MNFIMDPDLLDCPICFENLAPPIYQCYNGHIACSSCSTRVKNCPSCSCLIGLRCLAIEKVIESIKVSCPYASSGCGEIVKYADRLVHEGACTYSPCHCPIAECTFESSIQELYCHFSSRHVRVAISFRYNQSVTVYMLDDTLFRVLRGNDGALFLILNKTEVSMDNTEREAPMGNAVMVACLGPDSMKEDYTYQVKAIGEESSIQFVSSMTTIKRWEGGFPPKGYLLVPRDFCAKQLHRPKGYCLDPLEICAKRLTLEIIVRKKKRSTSRKLTKMVMSDDSD